MKLTAENIVKHIPLLSGVAVIGGILKSIVYYKFFGLRIIPYLEPSEYLLMFVDDIIKVVTILAVCVLVVEFYVDRKTLSTQDEESAMNVTKIRLQKGKKLSRRILFIVMIFFIGWSAYLGYLIGIYCAINTLVILFCFLFIPAAVAKLLIFFWERNEEHTSLIFSLGICVLVVLWMAAAGFNDANSERYLSDKKFTVALRSDSLIKNSDSCLYIGRTKNYAIFYNQKSGLNRIIPVSEIKYEYVK